MFRTHAATLVLVAAPLCLPACKGGRAKLEQLVPDGATGMASLDAKSFFSSDAYASIKGANGEAKAKIDEVLGKLRDDCDVDLEKMDSAVGGFDAISQSGMGAVRVPNLGKAEALTCIDGVAKELGGRSLWTVGETDGKPSISIADGELVGWAMDDDTLVVSTKGWSSAVQARIKGESKGAIDNNLAEAVALADRSKQIWFAAQVPGVMEAFLKDSPAAGLQRGGGSLVYGENIEMAWAVQFADEASAKSLHEVIERGLEDFGPMALAAGLPKDSVDGIKFELDGAILRMEASVPLAPLVEQSTAAFNKYINRSKSSEARVQIAKMFDSASAYFNEEHVDRGAVEVIGAGGALSDLAPHRCPNNGKASGESGVTPPFSVKCSDGPDGKCVPGGKGPGGYDMSLWDDNEVWSGLNFGHEQGHYFHYNFKWTNDLEGYGSCQFTAQAFGDLDGDGIYSTYERAGAGDQNGINGAAGLYIDKEVE